jgi:hypothetical protein
MDVDVLTTVYEGRDTADRETAERVKSRARETTTTLEQEERKRNAAAESLQRQRSAAVLQQLQKEEQERVRVMQQGAQAQQNLLGRFLPAGLQSSIFNLQGLANDIRAISAAEQAAGEAGGDLTKVSAGAAGALGGLAEVAGPLAVALAVVAAEEAVLVGAFIAGGAAIYELTSTAGEAGEKLYELHVKTGLSVETLSALDSGARLTGGSVERLGMGLVIFNRNLEAARQGTGRQKDAFKDLNVDLRDHEAVLGALFEKLRAAQLQGNGTAVAMQYFGRSGAEMLKIVEASGGSLEKFKQQLAGADELITGEQATAAHEYEESWRRIGLQLTAIERQLGFRLLPAVEEVAKGTNDALKESEGAWEAFGFVVDGVGRFIKGNVGTIIEQMNELRAAIVLVNEAATGLPHPVSTAQSYLVAPGEEAVPAPKMPSMKDMAAGLPEVTDEETAKGVAAQAQHDFAEAQRKLEAAKAELARVQAVTPSMTSEAFQNMQQAAADATRAQLTYLQAQIQAKEFERKAVVETDDPKKVREQREKVNDEITKLEDQKRSVRQKADDEALQQQQQFQQKQLQLQRDAINSTAQMAAREAQSVYQYRLHAAQQSYEEGLSSLATYVKAEHDLLAQHHEQTLEALGRELTAAGTVTDPQQRAKQQAEVNAKITEENRKFQQQSDDIDFKRREQERTALKAHNEALIALHEQADQRELEEMKLTGATATEIEEERARRELLIMHNRMLLAYQERDRFQRDDPRYRAAQDEVDKLMEEASRQSDEHFQKMADARMEDTRNAQQYAETLRAVNKQIEESNQSVRQSQIEALRAFPASDDAARAMQTALDLAKEQTRSAAELAALYNQRTLAGVTRDTDTDPIKRREAANQYDALSREIEAKEREHQQRMTDIRHKAAEEERQDRLKKEEDISKILIAGLDAFDGHWGNIWKAMAQTAIGEVRQIADELAKSGLEAILDPNHKTRGSAAGGLVGSITNMILKQFGLLDTGMQAADVAATTANTTATVANTAALLDVAAAIGVSGGGTGGGAVGLGVSLLTGLLGGIGGGFMKGGIGGGTIGKVTPHATGGRGYSGLMEVGEQGPELIDLLGSGDIYTAAQTNDIVMKGGRGGDTINIVMPRMQSRSYVQRRAMREGAEMVSSLVGQRRKH